MKFTLTRIESKVQSKIAVEAKKNGATISEIIEGMWWCYKRYKKEWFNLKK